ncbi:hypothetical protein ACHAXT_006089 [Thalassiosira profunda]
MPPKKKAGKKKKSKKEVSPEEQRRQDLLQRALALQGEAQNEQALEAQFAKQTEQLQGYWEIEKKERDARKRTLLEKEHRLRGIKDGHAVELGKYKQTVKELLFANQDELAEKTTQSFVERQSQSDRHQNEVGQLHDELQGVSIRIQETDASHDKYKISMRNGSIDKVAALREEAGRRIASLAAYSEEQFRRTRSDAEKRLMDETTELEGRNEAAIQGAMEKNAEEIQQLRTKYNTVMSTNLDAIATLRKEVVLLREQDRHDRRALGDLRNRNTGIVVPLETNRKDLDRLASDLDVFQRQKQDLAAQKDKLRHAQRDLEEIEWDHEVLFQKLEALELDRDRWKETARTSIHTARQKSSFECLLLERKLQKARAEGERCTAAISEVLQKADVDLDSLDQSHPVTELLRQHRARMDEKKEKAKE